ncbi:hypothetical protein ACFE04_024314 [Oxalis oulophora]
MAPSWLRRRRVSAARSVDFRDEYEKNCIWLLPAKKGNNVGAIVPVPGKPVVPGTNLNIGMELWSPPSVAKMRPNSSRTAPPVIMNDQWVQGHDDRELKRQKRKQSNRESSRRSRLRKQADEELQARVENLLTDNDRLKEELRKVSEECEKLMTENKTMKESNDNMLAGRFAYHNLKYLKMYSQKLLGARKDGAPLPLFTLSLTSKMFQVDNGT